MCLQCSAGVQRALDFFKYFSPGFSPNCIGRSKYVKNRANSGQTKLCISLWISSSYWLRVQEILLSWMPLWTLTSKAHRVSRPFPKTPSLPFPKPISRAALYFLSPQKPRTRLQRALQTCCADGHQLALCKGQLFSGHFIAIREHQNT